MKNIYKNSRIKEYIRKLFLNRVYEDMQKRRSKGTYRIFSLPSDAVEMEKEIIEKLRKKNNELYSQIF